jgi:ribosomal protein L11 methyltransferase
MAFGTGADETTRLCLEMLENTAIEGCSVLDIGCGSGILAIAAVLLGAGSAHGIDIDQAAVESAKGNAELNGVSDRCVFSCGDMRDSLPGEYDIVCANLSADAILALAPKAPMLPKPGGTLILSGIIEDREQEVMEALSKRGMSLKGRSEENGWVCAAFSS